MTDDVSFLGNPDPFDYWLKNGLRARFNDVVREPIPESLLRIISGSEASGRAHALSLAQAEVELMSKWSVASSTK